MMESPAVSRESFRYLPLDGWAGIPINQTKGILVINLSNGGVIFEYSEFSSEHVFQSDVLVFQWSNRQIQ